MGIWRSRRQEVDVQESSSGYPDVQEASIAYLLVKQ